MLDNDGQSLDMYHDKIVKDAHHLQQRTNENHDSMNRNRELFSLVMSWVRLADMYRLHPVNLERRLGG